MAETVIAFKCKDFVIVSAAGLSAFYYIKLTDSDDKIVELDSHKLVACTGESGHRDNFTRTMKANLQLNKIRQHGRDANTPAAAAFLRSSLAGALRSRGGAYMVNSLVAGYDVPASESDPTPEGTHLFYLDYLGTLQAVPFGAHGYGATFVTALLDSLWRPDLTPQEGLDLMQKCVNEVKQRIIISNANFITKVVTRAGIEVVPAVH